MTEEEHGEDYERRPICEEPLDRRQLLRKRYRRHRHSIPVTGKGLFTNGRKQLAKKAVGMIAGGSGITPMLQVGCLNVTLNDALRQIKRKERVRDRQRYRQRERETERKNEWMNKFHDEAIPNGV